MLLLSACAMGNSDPACVCPPVKTYDKDFQTKLATEIAAMNENDAVILVMQDYALVRKQLEVCQ